MLVESDAKLLVAVDGALYAITPSYIICDASIASLAPVGLPLIINCSSTVQRRGNNIAMAF